MSTKVARPRKRQKVSHSAEQEVEPHCQASFKYTQLQEGHIRVLNLSAGDRNQDLEGSLEICELSKSRYCAISYAWGSSKRSNSITIDGRLLYITAAAHSALCKFRTSSKARGLWLDSICINQRDVQERSAQVQQMGEIYRRADEVLVWLGEPIPSDSMAMWACDRLAISWAEWSAAKDVTDSSMWKNASKSGFARRSLTVPFYTGCCPCCQTQFPWKPNKYLDQNDMNINLYSVAQKSVRDLFAKPYFERLWPVQEICVARECTMYTGEHSIKFEDLYHALEMLGTLQDQLSHILQLYALIHESITTTKHSKSTIARPCVSLLDLIARTNHLKAGEGHDRIYALRDLTNASTRQRLFPDYSISLQQLWINAAACILTDGGDGPDRSSCVSSFSFVHPSAVLAQAAYQRCSLRRTRARLLNSCEMHRSDGFTFVPSRATFSYSKDASRSRAQRYRERFELDTWIKTTYSRAIPQDSEPPSLDREAHIVEDKSETDGPMRDAQRKAFQELQLPSWALDLQEDVSRHWIKYKHYDGLVRSFLAGGDTVFDVKLASQDPPRLEIKAKHLSTIEHLYELRVKSAADLSTLCSHAQQKGRFINLWSKNMQHRLVAASELTVLLLQGYTNVDDDGLALHLEQRDSFVKKFSSRRAGDDHDKPVQTASQNTLNNIPRIPTSSSVQDRQIAKFVFGRTYSILQSATGNGKFDINRSLAEFSDGRVGWVPHCCHIGDAVYLVQGAPCPFIFRRQHDGTYENLGDAYVHEIMRGEAWFNSEHKTCSLLLS